MKFVKVLINSLLSGCFFSSLIALLVLDLNINLPFNMKYYVMLTLYLTLIYGLIITLLCILCFFIIQFFSGKSIGLTFISPSFLLMSFTLLIFLFLLIFNKNYHFFNSLFTPEIVNLLKTQSTTLLFLAILGSLVAFTIFSYRRKIPFLIIYFILFFSAITYTIMQRINYPLPLKFEKISNLEAKKIEKKITIIGLEGLSFDFIIPLIIEDKLPNFSWLLEEGSWGKLENFTPNEPIILNSSFNTGKMPSKHRQLSYHEYRFFNLDPALHITPRYILFRQLTRIGLLRSNYIELPTYAKEIWAIFEANKTTYLKRDWPYQGKEVNYSPQAEVIFNRFFENLRFETSEILQIAKSSFCADIDFETSVTEEKEKSQPNLLYFLLSGLTRTETFFFKFSFPELFGEVDQEELNKYSTVIERYYQYYDEIIGKYLAAKKDDELLVVYSPHGI